MANKKQKAAPKKANQNAQPAAARNVPFFNTFAGQAVMVFIAIAGIVFLPTTVILLFGMLPTMAAMLVTTKGNMAKAYCVAAANFVGCYIFILSLWSRGQSFENTMEILINPISIVVMYAAAGVGYFLDWFFSNMMASVIQQRAKGRLISIRERQQVLVEQWGAKVTGNIPLDEDGFPILKD